MSQVLTFHELQLMICLWEREKISHYFIHEGSVEN